MYVIVIFLILVSRFPYKTAAAATGVCTPNSQTLLNGKVCNCNSTGQWTKEDCHAIGRRLTCMPGQVVFQGCSRCVCQESGQLVCSEDSSCTGPIHYHNVHETLIAVLPWCYPFRTYYINCNICICPASGKTSETRCAIDISCTLFRKPSTSDIVTKKNTCLPRVMYLFPCLHCLCSDDAHFSLSKCVETCEKKQIESSHRCIPKTLYRKDCNVCLCSNGNITDKKYCTNTTCNQSPTFGSMQTLKYKPTNCTPHEFVNPRCIYCNCGHDGVVDEKSCLELPCLQSDMIKYDVIKETCSPGEMVPFCTDCLCPRSGVTSEVFCTKGCSHQSKLKMLEKIVNLSKSKYVIDKQAIKLDTGSDVCKSNNIYFEQGRYCLCPETGILKSSNLCTATEKNFAWRNNKTSKNIYIDFNMTCEPSTFIEFDCNTCFCSKKGKIDPKWCTYDDCEAKRTIQEMGSVQITPTPEPLPGNFCDPGSISSVDCNFCICPDNGLVQHRICTKNECSSFVKAIVNSNEKLTCDPLAYYEVDCNLCYCPRDGIKNVAKCTNNLCEKRFLRSDDMCVAGQLFSDECNVCVCPPNGNKAEKACTNHTCTDPWKKIFQLSESLLGNQITEDATRNLDHCFPGEEFFSGCKICVCPDMGLRIYATCSPTFCVDERRGDTVDQELAGSNRAVALLKKLDTRRENCMVLNFTSALNREACTAGSMYIVKCKECICPYMGDISYFCRPMPKDFYCEQAFPGYNYVPMGRRIEEDNTTIVNASINSTVKDQTTVKIGNESVLINTTIASKHWKPITVLHEHTRYECNKPGRIGDDCFMCECDGEVLIAEHCFQSNATQCVEAVPTFLEDYIKYQTNPNQKKNPS